MKKTEFTDAAVKIERLTSDDYDEWLAVLNRVFTIKNKRNMDFNVELPKMCVCDDYHMNKHFAVKKNGKIVSVIGVYPFLVNLLEVEMLFATVGNIATLPEEEGNGYMSILIERAMEELNVMGVDASRLSGDRMRYNRYGYEYTGIICDFDILKAHLKKRYTDLKSDIVFTEVNENDFCYISRMKQIYEQEKFFVTRDNDDFYKTLCAWNYKPYVAVDRDGAVIGYLSVSASKDSIGEILAVSFDIYCEILLQWIINEGGDMVSIGIMPHKTKEISFISNLCQNVRITNPSMFKIINWEKVVNAFLQLKTRYMKIPEGQLVIDIENYGKLLLKAENDFVICKKTESDADISLSHLDAEKFLFGISSDQNISEFTRMLLPLPLSWNLLDRV